MRWLVEVSRVSDGSPTERYCIDARRWQSALQEVRRLRGDEGPLPKLTIELLDAGYRAVDPELKVRYIVSEAPADMPVTAGAQVRHSTQPPPAEGNGSVALPVAKTPSAVRGAAATPSIPASAAPSVPVSVSHAPEPLPGLIAAQIIRQRDESPTSERPIHYREIALAVRPGASRDGVEALMRARLEQARTSLDAGEAQQYVQIAVFDHMFVKRPVRPPVATLAWKNWRGDAVVAFPGFAKRAAESNPSSAGAPSTRPPSWGADSPSEVPPAGSLAPAPVVTIGSAFTMASAPAVAVVVPTVAAAPVVIAPRPGATGHLAQPEPTRSSVIPAPVVSVGVSRPSQPPPEREPPPPDSEDIPVPLVAKRSDVLTEDEVEISIEVPPPSGPMIDVSISSIPVSELPISALPPAAAPELETAAPPQRPRSIPPPKPNTVPPPKPDTVPPSITSPVPSTRPTPVPSSAPRRRAASEDLIGDLFERMHELAFMADLISGAEFIVQVLGELIPCEAVAVHVYDLGKREFVLVRAHGPKARDALLHRTADDEPLVRDIMSRRSATILDGAPANSPPVSSSLSKLGIQPRAVLCGAARLGGRYLGLIELANPHGSEPFHANEANALDYVCEQFAEFVASRPIVLDADVVIGQ